MPRDAEPLRLVLGDDQTTIRALCERVRDRLLGTGPAPPGTTITCEIAVRGTADLATVEALARLHLTAQRYGGSIVFRCPTGRLIELVELVGLHDVLRVSPADPA